MVFLEFCIKAGVNMKVLSRLRLKQSKISHSTYLRFGLLCKFVDDSWVYLGINSFSQRIRKNYGNRKFGVRFDVCFKIRNLS